MNRMNADREDNFSSAFLSFIIAFSS